MVQSGNVYGSYLHGLFDQDGISSKAIVEALLRAKGLDATAVQSFDMEQYKNQQYDRLADAVRESLDMEYIYRIMEEGVAQ